MKLQKCVTCGKEQPIDSFPAAGIVKGKFYRRRKCQECYWAVKKARRYSIRKWVNEQKQERGCKHCGNGDFRVLEFHHVDGKDFEIATAIKLGYSKKRIEKELKRCICLCANCHRIEHYQEIDNGM